MKRKVGNPFVGEKIENSIISFSLIERFKSSNSASSSNLIPNPMDNNPSNSDDHHVNVNANVEEEEEEEPSIVTHKSLPYHSMLLQLHALEPQHELWTSGCRWATMEPLTPQQLWTMEHEVKLQQMIFFLFQNHGVRSEFFLDIQTMAETEAENFQQFVARFAHFEPRHRRPNRFEAIPQIMETSHQKIKPHLKEFCLGVVDQLLQGGCSTGEYGIFAFINVILLKLKDFKKLKPNMFDHVKKQMQMLEQMLNYAPIIASKMTNLDENLQNYLEFFVHWVNTAAAIVILFWFDEKPLSMISSSLHKFDLNILEKVEAYILVIKALRPSNASEILLMRNTVEQFIGMILYNFIVSTDDRFDMFREGLAFWTALLVDPPKSDAEHEKLICSHANVLLDQAKSLICSLCLNKLGEGVAERRNTLLNDFLEKINEAKVEVRQLQVHQIPGFSCINDPKANTRRRFDLLLGTLQKKFEVEAGFLPFEKHLIAIVHEELSLLRPSLLDMFELQDEHKELRDICVQASNTAYLVDYITDFCLSSTDIPIWSNLIHLSNAIEKIQSIKTQISNIRQNDPMNNNIIMRPTLNAQRVLPLRHEAYDATTKDDFKVGFVEEEQRIIDFLLSNEARRTIVAVVGMGGQGKTHLAHRVFHDKGIKDQFRKLAWGCISQAYDIKNVFSDILESFGETVIPELTQQDLSWKLRKCLMGQKYLVVLDDMWDAKAWFDLEESFPDCKNGSRILLTSRNCDVALKVKANCSIVELNPLSHEESWNLLRMKVFHGDYCPSSLSEIGKTVAANCRGIPLAVVLVAGLLKKDKDVECWKQISESLKAHMASEGCMDIIEMSYKHLPDYLKPCFLYLGAFQEDEIIDAKKLIQFWIAEGFVKSDGIKSTEVVANEYLVDLASRSLIFVYQISSRNEIKKCYVHDLLHQLCQIKVEEERFMLVINEVPDHSSYLRDSLFLMRLEDLLESGSVGSYHEDTTGHSFTLVRDDLSDGCFILVVDDGSPLSITMVRDDAWDSPFTIVRDGFSSLNLNDGYCRLIVDDTCHVNAVFDLQPFLPSLRSLVYLRPARSRPQSPVFLKTFKFLRVLNLSDAHVTRTIFESMTQLIHLILLAFVSEFPIPPSIVNLLKLEVLQFNFAGNDGISLPSVVTEMASLQHIFARNCQFQYIDWYDQLVPDMSFPLTNLETLSTAFFEDELSFKRVAQSLHNLLKLGFECWSCFRLSSYFKRLESLKLNIMSPHWRLQKEIISPSTLDFPSTLKKLNLITWRPLSGAMISSIGILTHLEVLKLEAQFENDTWEVEEDEFLQLKYLYIRRSSVQEWNVSQESFPRLEQLLVRHCGKLGELPVRFGSVFTLTRIEVSDCGDSLTDSFQQIVDEQMDAGNDGLEYSIS